MCVDDEPFNLIAIKYNLEAALKLVRKDCCGLIDDILHEASFG